MENKMFVLLLLLESLTYGSIGNLPFHLVYSYPYLLEMLYWLLCAILIKDNYSSVIITVK